MTITCPYGYCYKISFWDYDSGWVVKFYLAFFYALDSGR